MRMKGKGNIRPKKKRIPGDMGLVDEYLMPSSHRVGCNSPAGGQYRKLKAEGKGDPAKVARRKPDLWIVL